MRVKLVHIATYTQETKASTTAVEDGITHWSISLSASQSIGPSVRSSGINPASVIGGSTPAKPDALPVAFANGKSIRIAGRMLSPWCRSRHKRAFDVFCVCIALPLLIPVFFIISVAVTVTSPGPIFFIQKRMGRFGRMFSIYKFRTLTHCKKTTHHAVTTVENQKFTPVGRFLRRWKLDELPQLINVLTGDMSLVGPRPKLPEHQVALISCRPGITGAATVAFAREESLLASIPKDQLNHYYHSVILPTKHWLDARYASRSTFRSDLTMLVNSVLRRWDSSVVDSLIYAHYQASSADSGSGSAKSTTLRSSNTSAMIAADKLLID